MVRRFTGFVSTFASLLASTAVVAMAGQASAQTYGPDPRVTAGTLDNGLSYLLMPLEAVEGQQHGAAVRLIVDAGLIHENEGQWGTSSVAAETARLRAGDGATAGVKEDQAVIGIDLADDSTLAARLSQLAGLASGAAVPASTIDVARASVAAKVGGLTPEQRVHQQAMRRLNPGSRAVRQPAGSLPDAIRAVTPAATTEFMTRWYVPSNMTVVVTAEGTADELRGLVQGAFGALPRVPKPASPATNAAQWSVPPAPIIIEDADLTSAIVGIVSARPGRAPASPRDFRSSLVQESGLELLERMVLTRMIKGKVPFTFADTSRFYGSEGLTWTTFHVMGDPAKWQELVTAAIGEVNRHRIHGMDNLEARETLIAMAGNWDEQAAAEETANAPALADMLVRTRGGPSQRDRTELLVALVGSVTADDMEWEFNKRFDPSSAAIVVALPSRPGNPSEAMVRETVAAAWSSQPEATSELVRPWKLFPELPVPGEVAEMSQDPETGVWSGWMSNGVRFHVRQMAARKPGGIEIGMTIAGGELIETAPTRGLSEVVAQSWNSLSTPNMSAEDLAALLTPSGSRFQTWAQPDQMRLSVTTDTAWFNAHMQRLHAMLTQSVQSQRTIDQLVATRTERSEAFGSDASETFGVLLANTQYAPGEVRVRPPTPDMARALTPEAATAWRERIMACPMEIAITGDVDPADAIEAIRFYLGSLPARPRISSETFAELRTARLNPVPHAGSTMLDAMGGTSSLILHGFYVCQPSEREDAMALLAAAAALNNRLNSNAPALGLPGGGFVTTNFSPAYPGTSFLFYGIQAQGLNEEGVAHVARTAREQFARFAAEGPTDEELAPVLDTLANDSEAGMDMPTAWWDHMCAMTYRGLTIQDMIRQPLQYRQLTREAVREVFAKYMNRENNSLDITVIPQPPDGLIDFINNPPPAPIIDEPAVPAGPPSGDPDAAPQPATPQGPG